MTSRKRPKTECKCKYCNTVTKGNAGKKFCDYHCKNNFNNARYKADKHK